MGVRIQLRNDLAINWTTKNPVLAQGEVGIENDTMKMKIGDGVTHWNLLNYYQFGSSTGYVQSGGYVGTAQDLKEEIDDISNVETDLQIHVSNTNNPHQVTKVQLGLGDVDNTSDISKPISTATQTALDLKVDKVIGKSLTTNHLTNALLVSILDSIAKTDIIVTNGDGKNFFANNGTYINLTSLDGGNASTIF